MAIDKIIVNQDFIKQVESRAAEKLHKTQQLSLEDIATVLNVRRMEGMEFAQSQSVRMFSPEFGIFTGQRSIMSAGEMSEYMKAGYIPHASSNTNFITVPILPFAIGGESDELFSSFVSAYEVSKSAGMASGAFFIPLGDLRYLPNRFKGEKTKDIIPDIQALSKGIEIDSIVNPFVIKNRITGSMQEVPYMPIAGESSRNELLFSSGHWINKGTGKNDASSIKLQLTGYSYIDKSGEVKTIDPFLKVRGKYELPDNALPIFQVSIALNNGTSVKPYTLDMRQLYDENAKILQAFFQRAEVEKIKASPEMIFDAISSKSARLPDAMFASRISNKPYKGVPISDADYFIDIETTPNISGKSYMTEFGFAYGENVPAKSLYTKFSFAGGRSAEEAAALTTKFKNFQIDRVNARMLDILRTGEMGEDIIESADQLNKMMSNAQRIIGYNLKKFDIPQLNAAGVKFGNVTEVVDVYEFISSHKRIVEEYFGVDFKDKLTLENVYNTLLKAGSVSGIKGQAHEAGYDVLMTREVYRAISPIMQASESDSAFTEFDRFSVLAGRSTFRKIVQANEDVIGSKQANQFLKKDYQKLSTLRKDFIKVLNAGSENDNVRTRLIKSPWKYSGGAISSIDVFDMADETKGIRVNMAVGQQVSDIVEAIRAGKGKFENLVYHGVQGTLHIGEDYSAIFRPIGGIEYGDVADISFGEGDNYLRFTKSIRDYLKNDIAKSIVDEEEFKREMQNSVAKLLKPMMDESEMKPYMYLFESLYSDESASRIAGTKELKKLYHSAFEWLINERNKPAGAQSAETLEFMSVAFKNIVMHNSKIDESPIKPFENIFRLKANMLEIDPQLYEKTRQVISEMTDSELNKLNDQDFFNDILGRIFGPGKQIGRNRISGEQIGRNRISQIKRILESTVITKKISTVKAGDVYSESARFNELVDAMTDVLKASMRGKITDSAGEADPIKYSYILSEILLKIYGKLDIVNKSFHQPHLGRIKYGDIYIPVPEFDKAAREFLEELFIDQKDNKVEEELKDLINESVIFSATTEGKPELDPYSKEMIDRIEAAEAIIEEKRNIYTASKSNEQLTNKLDTLLKEIKELEKGPQTPAIISKIEYKKNEIVSLMNKGQVNSSDEEDWLDWSRDAENTILKSRGSDYDTYEPMVEKITEAGDQTIEKLVAYVPSQAYIFEDSFTNNFLKIKLLEENLITDQSNFSQYFKAFYKFYEAEMAIEASRLSRFQHMDPKSFAARMSDESVKRRIAQEAWRDVRLFVSKRAGQSILDNVDAPNIYNLVRTRQLIDRQQLMDRIFINEKNIDFGGKTSELFQELTPEEKMEVYEMLDFGNVNSHQRAADESSRLIYKSIDASTKIEAKYSGLIRDDAGKFAIKGRRQQFAEFIGSLKRQIDIIGGRGIDLTTEEYIDMLPKISLHSSAINDSIEALDALYEQWQSLPVDQKNTFTKAFNTHVENLWSMLKDVAETMEGITIEEDIDDVANQLLSFKNQNVFFAKMYAGIDSVKYRGRIHKWSVNKDTMPELRAGAVITLKNKKQYTVEKMIRGVPILIDEEGHRVTFRAGIKGSSYSMISELVEYTGQPLGPIDQEYIAGATNMLLKIGMGGKGIDYAAKNIGQVSENVGYASREILDFLNRNLDMTSESFFNFSSGYVNALKGMGYSVPIGRLRVAEYIQSHADEIFQEISKDPSRAMDVTRRMATFIPDARSVFVNQRETPNMLRLYNKLSNEIKTISDVDIDVSTDIKPSITKDLLNDYVYRSLNEGVDWRNVTRENLMENMREDSRLYKAMLANNNDLDKAAAALLEEDKGLIGLLEPLQNDYRLFKQLISNYNMAGSESTKQILASAIDFYRNNKDVDFQLLKNITYSAIRAGGFYETLSYGEKEKWVTKTGDTSKNALEQVYRLETISKEAPEASGLSPKLRNVMILAAGGDKNAQAEIDKIREVYDLSFFDRSKPVLESYMDKVKITGDERKMFASYFYNIYEGEGSRSIHGGDILQAVEKIHKIYSQDQEFIKLVGEIEGADVNKVAAAFRSYNSGRINEEVMGAFKEYVSKNASKLNKNNIEFLLTKLYDLSDGDLDSALSRVYGEGYEQVTGNLDPRGKLLLAMDISRVISEREYKKPGILTRLFQSLMGRKEASDDILNELGLQGLDEEAFRTMFGVEKAEASKIFKESAEGTASKAAKKLPKINMDLKGILPGVTVTGGIIGLFIAIGAKARAEARHMEEEMRNTQMVNTLSSVNLIANSMRYSPTEPEVAATMSVNGQENIDASGAMMSNLGIRNGYITYRS